MNNVLFKIGCSLGAIALFAASLYISFSANAQDEVVADLELENSGVTSGFVGEMNMLESVKLDPSVFTNESFKSLEDFSRPLPEEAKGRSNPFAPIN